MKLYATVTSERATKGQGGNHYLDIKLTYQLPQGRAHYGALTLSENGVLTFIYPTGEVKTICTLSQLGITTIESKGNKQKGEQMPLRATDGEWDKQ